MKVFFVASFCLLIPKMLFAADPSFCLNFDYAQGTYKINYIDDKAMTQACCSQTDSMSNASCSSSQLNQHVRENLINKILFSKNVKNGKNNRNDASIFINKKDMKFYANADCNIPKDNVEITLKKGYQPEKISSDGISYKVYYDGTSYVFSFKYPAKKKDSAKEGMINFFIVNEKAKDICVPNDEYAEAVTDEAQYESNKVPTPATTPTNPATPITSVTPVTPLSTATTEDVKEDKIPLASFYKDMIKDLKNMTKDADVYSVAHILPCSTTTQVGNKQFFTRRNLDLASLVLDIRARAVEHSFRFKGVKHGNYSGANLQPAMTCKTHCNGLDGGGFDASCGQ